MQPAMEADPGRAPWRDVLLTVGRTVLAAEEGKAASVSRVRAYLRAR